MSERTILFKGPKAQEAWEKEKVNATTPFKKFIIRFAEEWAELMEKELISIPKEDVDHTIMKVAASTSRKVGAAFVHSSVKKVAYSRLVRYWKYGASLKKVSLNF